ncbi:MAG: serine/threonine-protein phosphatase [Roseiflexaceae bacterium]|nr:serine/threonine-protein phosphatase [Roseiflexaceae bacterium]
MKQQHRHQRATLLGHCGAATARRIGLSSTNRNAAARDAQRQAEIEQELLLARDIQQGLLLEAVPRLLGYEISAVCLPARDLGGDLYDFLALGGGQHAIMIGDVSGKGLPAALRMAVARTVFRHEARRGLLPSTTLAAVNQTVLTDIPQGMVTMLYTTLDLDSGVLRMANAGHNFPIIINGAVSEVELTGLPLGVDSECSYREMVHTLHHGDTVFFFTDGVVEALNPAGAMFGDDRLQALLGACAAMKPRAMVARLVHELRQWGCGTQADDITLVVLRRRCAALGDELHLAVVDVLGAERAGWLWAELELSTCTTTAAWTAQLPEITQCVQAHFGRGLARELQGQLRAVAEEYR